MHEKRLDAVAGGVGPFELDGEGAELFGFPGADVADFAVVVVVPALARDGVGDGFAEFMGAGGGESVEVGYAAKTARATWVGHDGVEDAVVDRVVIAAEDLAGGATALGDGDSGGKENEIEGIRGCGGQCARRDLLLQKRLDGRVVDRCSRIGIRERDAADTRAVADLLTRDAVFGELVEKLAGKDKVEELIHLREKRILRGFVPGRAPENSKNLRGGEQGSVAVGELGSDLWGGYFGLSWMERNNSYGVVKLGRTSFGRPSSFWTFGARLGRQWSLLRTRGWGTKI